MKYMFDIIMCQNTYEPVCFKLCMVLNTTELHSLIAVGMTEMLTQGHRVTGKVEVLQSLGCKVA